MLLFFREKATCRKIKKKELGLTASVAAENVTTSWEKSALFLSGYHLKLPVKDAALAAHSYNFSVSTLES